MKMRIVLFLFVLLFFQLIKAQNLDIAPQNLSAELSYNSTESQTLTITNNGTTPLSFSIEGVKTRILALTNFVDMNFVYPTTINALTAAYDNYELTEISVTNQNSSIDAFANALIETDVLLIPHQNENCSIYLFSNLATTLQNFVENGGTIVFTGTSRTYFDDVSGYGDCIAATNLFSDTYALFVPSDTTLELTSPNDFLMAGVSNPYEMQTSTYCHNFSDTDAVKVVAYRNNSVVTYRNIGEGRAILIGHNYFESNTDMVKILANAVKSGGGIEWLNLDVFEGTIGAGESQTIEVTFNTATTLGTLYGGLYEADLIVSNGENEMTVPLSLVVSGTPEFEATPSSFDFGETFTTDIATQILTIKNTGTDSLFITNITSDNPNFNIAQTAAALYGGHTLDLEVFYTPLTAETDNGNLYIYTNADAMPFVITLTGEGIVSSIISPMPASIELTLNVGETAIETVTIQNAGLADLDFTLNFGQNLDNKNLLIYGVVPALSDWSFNDFSAVVENIPNLNITKSSTYDLAEMQNLLQKNNIMLIIGSQGIFNSQPQLINNFINNGGHVIFFDISLLSIANSLGLFEGTASFGTLGNFGAYEDHPITENVIGSSYPLYDVDFVDFTNDVRPLVGYTDWLSLKPVVALNEQNFGKAVFISLYADYIYTQKTKTILENTVRFLSDCTTPTWLSFPLENNTFSNISFPNGTASFDLNFDTDGLAVGTYFSEIVLENNGITPNFSIPITLNVVGGTPQIEMETTNIDFGDVFVGQTASQNVLIQNTGTDTLFITDILLDNVFFFIPQTTQVFLYFLLIILK